MLLYNSIMKMNRSLSVIDEDESKYDCNPDNDETNVVFLPPNIMSTVTIILNILNETYVRILDCLKGTNHTEKGL